MSLPKSSLSEVLAGKRAITKPMLNTFIRACGVSDAGEIQLWLNAWSRVVLAGLKPENLKQASSETHVIEPALSQRVVAQLIRLTGIAANCQEGQHQSVATEIVEVVESLKLIVEPARRDIIPLLEKQGIYHLGIGSHEKAQHAFEALLDACRAEYGDSPQTTNAKYHLAKTLRMRWKLDEALALLDAPTRTLIARGVDRGVAMRSALELQTILRRLKRPDEALSVCKSAIERREWATAGGDKDYYLLYVALAELQAEQGQFRDAQSTFDRFLYMAHNSGKVSTDVMLRGLHAYLPLLRKISSSTAGDTIQREIWDLEYKALAAELRDELSGVLGVAGKIGIWVNLKAHARQVMETTLAVARELFGHDRAQLLKPLEALAEFHKAESEFAEARLLYEEIFEISVGLYGRYSRQALYAAWDLQEVLGSSGDHEATYSNGLAVLDIERMAQGVGSQDTIDTMIEVGRLALVTSRPHDALSHLTEAQGLLERNKEDIYQYAAISCFVNLAATYSALGDSEAANSALAEAVERCRTHEADSASLTETVAKTAAELGRRDLAQEFYGLALSSSGPDASEQLLRTLNKLME
ncbi:tetratricopeptide repeat protein [Micromonospora sp. NPDC049049]|uniref:tetratricopeptide repeat protein n=1 Tax=Micromonospora sp. NPDC049049 TaxID=3155495 RepID=UPI0033D9EE8A